ncbi:MAG: HAMP domain-containing sensor histidine kinase [Jatrophihabitantaceae bacterium]
MADRFLLRWWRHRSLRARITVLATALFTVALVLAGVVLLLAVNAALLNTLDSSAQRSGAEVAALVRSGRLPAQVLAGSGGVSLVQVVDADNRVVAASPGADTAVSVLRPDELAAVRGGAEETVLGERASLDEPLRVVGVPADIRAGQRTVLVGTVLGRVHDSSRLLQRGLLLGGPVIVAMMAALTWWLVGLTLRPVAALQRGAAELSAAGLARSRLPVPAASDEIQTLATTLNTMLDRLDSATAKQRRFVGDAAHELRSPIASLRLQLEVAQRLDPDGAVRELATDALLDVNRLSNLIDDLLLLARADERGPARSRQPVRLDELVAAGVSGYAEARVAVRAAECVPAVVLGEAAGLHRVLVNLIDNAVRYARSSVLVSVREPAGEPGMVCLSVADDGPGVPAGEREQVFDRFYRLEDARSRVEGGTGLGLSIVREIVTAHGGAVRLRDNDPGLCVQVLLPFAGEVAPALRGDSSSG